MMGHGQLGVRCIFVFNSEVSLGTKCSFLHALEVCFCKPSMRAPRRVCALRRTSLTLCYEMHASALKLGSMVSHRDIRKNTCVV